MSESTNTVRVLSIDGGGIRGLIPALVLAAMERIAGKLIVDMFALIAGTSTGDSTSRVSSALPICIIGMYSI